MALNGMQVGDPLSALLRGGGEANDPVQLALMRQQQADEMRHNLELEQSAPAGHAFTSGSTPGDLKSVESDLAEAPGTGIAAQQDVAKQDALRSMLFDYNRPDVRAQRNEEMGGKMALAGAPAAAAGQYGLAVEQEKNRGALDLAKQQQDPFNRLMGGGADASAGGSVESNGMGGYKATINPKGGVSLAQTGTPQQVQAQQHAAAVGLTQIPATHQLIDKLDSMGALGPVAGRWHDALASTGLDSVFSNPQTAGAFNDFKTQLSLIKSNLAYAHGAARGGSSPGMQQRFDQLLNQNQSPASLHAGLNAAERWLTHYANAKNSNELDAADAELGVTGGPYERPQTPGAQ